MIITSDDYHPSLDRFTSSSLPSPPLLSVPFFVVPLGPAQPSPAHRCIASGSPQLLGVASERTAEALKRVEDSVGRAVLLLRLKPSGLTSLLLFSSLGRRSCAGALSVSPNVLYVHSIGRGYCSPVRRVRSRGRWAGEQAGRRRSGQTGGDGHIIKM